MGYVSSGIRVLVLGFWFSGFVFLGWVWGFGLGFSFKDHSFRLSVCFKGSFLVSALDFSYQFSY